MVRTSYKSQDLIYEEPGYKLVIYLEMSVKGKLDWIACDTTLEKWTEPREENITEVHLAKIIQRLSVWSEQQKVRIGFGSPLDLQKMGSDLEKKGWTIEKRDNGVTAFRPPAKRGFAAQVRSLLRNQKRNPNQPPSGAGHL
jgi:hypothetical protein